MQAFVTGSRAYGTPREDSDIYLVAYVSKADFEKLRAIAVRDGEEGSKEYGVDSESACLRFGELNLILDDTQHMIALEIAWTWIQSKYGRPPIRFPRPKERA